MATFRGNQIDGLVRQTGDTIEQLDDGTWSASVIFMCRWANVVQFAPKRNVAVHPDFDALKCNGCKIDRLKPGDVARMTATYRGFFGSETGPEPPTLPDSTEETVTSMSDAPIETHPDFVAVLGGTKESPKNGAVFNDDGTFKGWKADSRYAGKEAYLVGSTIYRKTTPSRSRPGSVGPVGQIQSPGIGGGAAGADWLFTSQTWRRDGAVYEVSLEYMLSGPGGWDPTIYS